MSLAYRPSATSNSAKLTQSQPRRQPKQLPASPLLAHWQKVDGVLVCTWTRQD